MMDIETPGEADGLVIITHRPGFVRVSVGKSQVASFVMNEQVFAFIDSLEHAAVKAGLSRLDFDAETKTEH